MGVENVVKQAETKNYIVQVVYDPWPMNPITENDNLGEQVERQRGMPCLTNLTNREIVEQYGHCVIVKISTQDYTKLYWKITKDEYVKEFGQWDHKHCIEVCEAYAEEFSNYYNGEVYGFKVINKETGDEEDSCWGFIGDVDYCLSEGLAVAKSLEETEVETLQFMNRHFVV